MRFESGEHGIKPFDMTYLEDKAASLSDGAQFSGFLRGLGKGLLD